MACGCRATEKKSVDSLSGEGIGRVRNKKACLPDGTVAHHHALDRLHFDGVLQPFAARKRDKGKGRETVW